MNGSVPPHPHSHLPSQCCSILLKPPKSWDVQPRPFWMGAFQCRTECICCCSIPGWELESRDKSRSAVSGAKDVSRNPSFLAQTFQHQCFMEEEKRGWQPKLPSDWSHIWCRDGSRSLGCVCDRGGGPAFRLGKAGAPQRWDVITTWS